MNGQTVIYIPAAVNGVPGVFTMTGSVKYLTSISLSGPYSVKYGLNQTNIVNPGDGFGTTNSATYASVTFYNTAGIAVIATVYTGLEPTQLASTTINNSITVNGTITAPLASAAEAVPGQLLVAANAGVVTPLSVAALYVTWFEIVAQNTYAGGVNAGSVRLGSSAAANSQPRALAPGDAWDVSAKAGGKIDLNKIYMATANNGDGVTILYFQ